MAVVSLASLALPRGVRAVTLGEEVVSDRYGYRFRIPKAGWTKSTANLSGSRQVTAFVSEADGDSNINMVETPIPGDFQKLTSFGTLDNVLDTLVPRGKVGVDGAVISSIVDAKKNAYVVEYTIAARGVERHLVTVFALQPGRFLLTLTGQAKSENWPKQEAIMRAVTDSFALKILD